MQVTEVLHKKILLLSANPISTTRLRTDEEMREIEESLKRATKRELFSIQTSTAVTYRDIRRAILDYQPNIVQFSGHGEGEEGLIFEDNTGESKLVSDKALAGLFELFTDQVECVFLNACYSQVQAESIVKHIPYVIGMSQEISDEAAIEFATGFYDALGAGETFDFAFKFGCNGIMLADISEELTPQLLKQPKYDDCELNGKQIITSEEVQEENPKTRVCNLLFEYEEDNFSKIQVIQSMLREIVGDDSITIVDIEKGSIKLILQGSQAGLERLEALFNSGELQELLGVPIEDVSFVNKKVLVSPDGNQIEGDSKLAFTLASDISQEEILNLKDKLVKASKDSYITQKLVNSADSASLLEFNQPTFLKGVLEGLPDGILILDQEGKLIHANSQGINQYRNLHNSSNSEQVPEEILQVRDALLECRRLFPRRTMVIELGIPTKDGKNLRLRGRWLSLSESAPDYVLITIEDCQNSRRSLISPNRRKYGFTAREAEIWSLRRAKYSYKEIAAKLHISEDTVKKHIKSINAKRKQASAGKGKFFTASIDRPEV